MRNNYANESTRSTFTGLTQDTGDRLLDSFRAHELEP
jgi:hypothetical protein